MTWIAVALAVAGACCYAFGARRQNTAVRRPGRSALSLDALAGLLRDRGWLAGLVLLGGGTMLHVTAVTLAPLTVVQPIGALALVITAVLHARARGIRLNTASVIAIAACVGGVATFVVLATGAVRPPAVTWTDETHALTVLGAVGVVLGTVVAVQTARTGRYRGLAHTVAAGAAFGFVATLTRVLTQRVAADGIGAVSPLTVLGITAAMLVGGWCVQQAHAAAPPDLVVAGLTVIDPLVAVGLGLTVLGEAPHLSAFTMAALGVAALAATTGVVLLARHHPDATDHARAPGHAIAGHADHDAGATRAAGTDEPARTGRAPHGPGRSRATAFAYRTTRSIT